jgi:hypothetical protein
MHVTRSKTGAKSETVSSANDTMKGTMITMALTMTSPIGTNLWLEDAMKRGGVKAFSHDLKRVCCPLNFKPSRIKNYDGSTNPAEWLEVYQLNTEATGGDSYVVANYLPICLSSSANTWLIWLPTKAVHSWSNLCW